MAAGAHNNGPGQPLPVALDILAGQKAAHAVPQDKIGQLGVIFLCEGAQGVNVLQHTAVAVGLGKKAPVFFARHRKAVAQMVVAHHQKALCGQPAGKAVIPAHVLVHTVNELQNRPRGTRGFPAGCADLRAAIGRKIEKFLHTGGLLASNGFSAGRHQA